MNSRQELKTVKQLSRLLTDETREIEKQRKRRTVIGAACWIAFVVAFTLAFNAGDVAGIVAVALALFAGAVYGFTLYWNMAADQWPAIKPHINHESVADRIKQLEK
jgi:O-antigen ligase